MNIKSVSATIKSVCGQQLHDAVDSDDEVERYVEIFIRPGDLATIGIDEHGNWCVVSGDRIWSPKKTNQFYVFLVLLESPLREVVDSIEAGLKEKSLPYSIAYTFPYDNLVLSALKSNSHWGELALNWIKQGYPINDEIKFELCGRDGQNKHWLQYTKKRLEKILN